jgi:hypothetical protein
MNEFKEEEERSDQYRMSVVIHLGVSAKGDHFLAFWKIEEEWWKLSDRKFGQVDETAIFDENFPVCNSEQTASLLTYSKTE